MSSFIKLSSCLINVNSRCLRSSDCHHVTAFTSIVFTPPPSPQLSQCLLFTLIVFTSPPSPWLSSPPLFTASSICRQLPSLPNKHDQTLGIRDIIFIFIFALIFYSVYFAFYWLNNLERYFPTDGRVLKIWERYLIQI